MFGRGDPAPTITVALLLYINEKVNPYCTKRSESKTVLIIVDLRINETLQTGVVRKPHLPFSRLVGTVSNSADAVQLETASTRGENVYLFFEFTIIPVLKQKFRKFKSLVFPDTVPRSRYCTDLGADISVQLRSPAHE